MNRRSFFKGLAIAAMCATTRLYSMAAAPIAEQTPLTLAEWAAKSNASEYGIPAIAAAGAAVSVQDGGNSLTVDNATPWRLTP